MVKKLYIIYAHVDVCETLSEDLTSGNRCEVYGPTRMHVGRVGEVGYREAPAKIFSGQ